MKTIRTFLAIPLPAPLARSASAWIHELKGGAETIAGSAAKQNQDRGKRRELPKPTSATTSLGIKWVPEDNLHLTLKFLGEVENVQIPEICDIASDVCEAFSPFELLFTGSGFLPDEARARVLTVKIEDPTESLRQIVARLEAGFAEVGFKRESRDYVPHLTLGRVRSGSRRASQQVIDRWRVHEHDPLGEMTAGQVQVIGSFLDKHGPTYNVMNTVELG